MSFWWHNHPQAFWLLLALSVYPVQAVIWEQCLIDIQMHPNAEEYVKNRTLFHADSTRDNPILTFYGCTSLCGGSGIHFYPDRGSIINTWILPALVISLKFVLSRILASELIFLGYTHTKSGTRRQRPMGFGLYFSQPNTLVYKDVARNR